MHHLPTYTTWKITCRSADEVQPLREWLASRIELEREFTDKVRTIPNGVEMVQSVLHRLGDYFADICILPDAQADPTSFRLVFYRRPDARRFWKDLMVNVLQEIETTAPTVSIKMDSKGDSFGERTGGRSLN
jgi:hypothetical protein